MYKKIKILNKLFPFHFIIDENLQIIKKGPSLKKISNKDKNFISQFRFIRPGIGIEYTFESIKGYINQIFIVELLDNKSVKLKGQFIKSDDNQVLIFCGSPWVTDELQITEMGLTISDFALNDSVVDMIQVLKANKLENEDKLQLMDEIEKQKLFYDQLLDVLPIELFILDKNFKVTYHNISTNAIEKAKSTLFDYLQLKGIIADNLLNTKNQLSEVTKTKSKVSFEELYQNNNIENVSLRYAMPMDFSDAKESILTYSVDITTLKQNRDQIIQKNNELEKINLELDNLIYSITHDFRSPVLSIKGMLNMMASSNLINEEQAQYCKIIKETLQRLDDTIIDVLTYSKNARLNLTFSQINLQPIIENTFDSNKHIVNYPIKLEVNISQICPFESDENRLKTLLSNLISNSIKYSDNTQLNSFIIVNAIIDKQFCNIEVIDNGIGIMPEHHSKVFDIFYRATSKSVGTGLGLFICSEVVKKLGGSISLKSKPYEGTTFFIQIPNQFKS